MMENITSRAEKRVFNSLSGTTTILDFLHDRYGIAHADDPEVVVHNEVQ